MDKKLEPFLKSNPEAWDRYKKKRRYNAIKKVVIFSKKGLKILSRIILWICAVGGFLLSLIQFIQDK